MRGEGLAYVYGYRWIAAGRVVGWAERVKTDIPDRAEVERRLVHEATPPVYWPHAEPLVIWREEIDD